MQIAVPDCPTESLPATDTVLCQLEDRVEQMADYYAHCFRLDRDDLAQDAWLAVFEALREFDPAIGELKPYLVQRARWRILDAIKYAISRKSSGLNAGSDDPAFLVFADEAGAEVAEFLAHLTPFQRQILACLMDGRTWRDTGDMLGCTSANIAYHVREIRRRYRCFESRQ